MFFIACRSQAEKMSNQLQIESYRISMRKLRTFYWKVTEFLNDDKITCLHMTFPDFTRHFLALLTEPIDTFCLAVLVR